MSTNIPAEYCRTYETKTKKSRAEIVGRIPKPEEEEEDDDDEEERSGRFLKDYDRRTGVNLDDIRSRVFGSSRTREDTSRRKKVANLLKRLLAEDDFK